MRVKFGASVPGWERHIVGTPHEVLVVDYRPDWPDEFSQIAVRIQEALGSLALRIDHIGSTSVHGLAAKDLIDVQVTVADFTPALEPAFQRAGYLRRAAISYDHRPPGAAGTDEDWQKQYYQPAAPARAVHVHVRRAGSANGRYPLLFRDYLRTHPLAAAAYAQVKRALANHGPTDWDLYYDVKDSRLRCHYGGSRGVGRRHTVAR